MNSADQFPALVSDYYDPLFRFALSLTRSEADALDLTQHTFLVWARKGHELRDPSKVKCWLFTTLHRAFLQARRREVRFPRQELEQTTEQLPDSSPELKERLDSAQVLCALAEVDEVFQGAVALFYLEDCSYKEIASILDIPLGTVRSRIARGIAQLRKILLSDESPAGGDWFRLNGASDNRNRIRNSSQRSDRTADCTILTGQRKRSGSRYPGFSSLNFNRAAQGLN